MSIMSLFWAVLSDIRLVYKSIRDCVYLGCLNVFIVVGVYVIVYNLL